jgi:hypothetical protein
VNLIANTGIQFLTIPISIHQNDNHKMFFYEWFDIDNQQLKLEIAHNFTEEEVWVRKRDLSELGFLRVKDEEINGNIVSKGNVSAEWADIKKVFIEENYKTIPIETETPKESGCFKIDLRKIQWDKFENKWLPFPFFTLNNYGKSEFGPINWCRCKIVPKSTDTNEKEYNLVFAFDTRTKYEDDGFEEDELLECPVFVSSHEESKDFAICDDEFKLIDFCSDAKNCGWVDNYLLKVFHNVTDFDNLRIKKPQLGYLAQYIYLLEYIQKSKVLPRIKLFSDKNVGSDNVDLVVDIGNSRTRAILFDNSDFTRVEPLALQNFTSLVRENKLNRNADSFEMRLAFREADFGGRLIEGSAQFGFPSIVRVGKEANELIHKATNLNTGVEKITTFSSPKRYLWDTKLQEKEWEFVTLEDEDSKSIWIEGISQQINLDGSFNAEGEGGIATFYSRRALMTFCFLEIFAQAKMQTNSYQFRKNWGKESTPRKIGRIIITCPTAMSKLEQIALRKAAEDAILVMRRFYTGNFRDKIDEREARGQIKVIPSVKGLSDTGNSDEWIYDEPTCAQFVYLYTEVKERYLKNTKEYFDFYGKVRKDLGDYSRNSVTIGSVDIGGGTTDIMIAAYKNDDKDECKLTPVPLFWESFYTAGDDLLKDLVKQLVIEGEYSAIENYLKAMNKENIAELILDFFGKDNARQSVEDRQIRRDFNIQVAVPAITYYLELLNENKTEKVTLSFNDIFASNLPTDRVAYKFKRHFGFSISDIKWKYDQEVLSKLIKRTFDNLASKISTILSYYGCDIVLLTGRPTSLKPLSDLFLKYYAVAPNRLIRLNTYRVGTWYPFHDGKGYFDDPKSIVAVGAMIGNYASTRGSLNGFSLDLSELNSKLQPTTEYFAKEIDSEAFITPQINYATLEVSQLPIRIWTRQLDTTSYPTRPFYNLEFNRDKIEEWVINRFNLSRDNIVRLKEETENRFESLQKLGPFKFNIVREDYSVDKETLVIDSVVDRNGEDIATTYFSFQIQSMSEDKGYWLDTGEFSNLSINHN